MQFRADFLRSAPPTTFEAVEKYPASGMIKGIGPGVQRGGVRCHRAEARASAGGRRHGTKSIVAAWADQKAIREIMIFLRSHGVGTPRANADLPDLRSRRYLADFR
jgi:exodeoxyribonuclease V alpha subunit